VTTEASATPQMAGDRDVARGVPMALSSVVSVQFGAGLAAHLFPRIGPLGAVSLRLTSASIVLLVVARPWRVRWTGAELSAALLFGLVLGAMNACLYTAISRLPMATAITLEALGPLTLTVVMAGGWRQRGWVTPAIVGVVLLGGSLRLSDGVGVVAAVGAATMWACYILLSRRVGRRTTGLTGLAVANTFGAVLLLPVGAAVAGSALLRPSTLGIGVAVGILSSALPYSLDLLALRRLPTALFGVLTSTNPAVAAVAGLLLLNQRLHLLEYAGVALVVVASAGMTLAASRQGSGAVVPPADVAP
jgi:inner membrane transporter RhtA